MEFIRSHLACLGATVNEKNVTSLSKRRPQPLNVSKRTHEN